ncbi:hypothetical protein E2C01_000075 [Portunus trituberculatus]|uniref:Uncharacterized protein n=1 Tax=Portunus trituberculatus TaxID=210409 RepID=A0A5B7CFC9_PORTR|nr:hypothetical protein [Portunus trituberculatus]
MKKFRVEEAQEQLEKYLRMRQEHPQWFTKLNILDPTLDELISTGYFFALPERDESGRRVFFSVGGAVNARPLLYYCQLLESEETRGSGNIVLVLICLQCVRLRALRVKTDGEA